MLDGTTHLCHSSRQMPPVALEKRHSSTVYSVLFASTLVDMHFPSRHPMAREELLANLRQQLGSTSKVAARQINVGRLLFPVYGF